MKIIKHDSDDQLLLDLYFPEIITGKYGEPETPAYILEKLKEVDGHGSGLDADTVDGCHASAFLLKNPVLSGHLAAVGLSGEIADGGTFADFETAFANNTSDTFK